MIILSSQKLFNVSQSAPRAKPGARTPISASGNTVMRSFAQADVGPYNHVACLFVPIVL
jgi:hypothetical protein